MFDRTYTRFWIALGWVVLFTIMWLTFAYTISGDVLISDLTNLEESVANEHWSIASLQMKDLEKHWKERQVPIQTNNATAEVGRFNNLLSQLKTLVNYQRVEALASIGELKNIALTITDVFPSP